MGHLCDLTSFNSFAIKQKCANLVEANDQQGLIDSALDTFQSAKPLLLVGGGSNIVLTDDFAGTVIKVATKGIDCSTSIEAFHLSVSAGENWHNLVEYTLNEGMPGLENLALIPGTVGAAPIQNIGAYGVELAQFCQWVEILDLTSGNIRRLTNAECEFAYRDSIFKKSLADKVVILRVGLLLPKAWKANFSYGALAELKKEKANISALDIFDRVCLLRTSKLPDPKLLGNAGSFFKNPLVSCDVFHRLQQNYPDIVAYPLSDTSVKLAAGWLIDKAGLKGFRQGDAGVHAKQALVLVNYGDATGKDICQLAQHIIHIIKQKFGVELIPEPKIIDKQGEVRITNV